jgi:hypothetical protein
MKQIIYLVILFFTISFFSCKKESDFILTDNETIFIENLKYAYQAEDIKVKRIIQLDTVVENSIEINVFNSELIAFDNPELNTYVDNIFVEFVKVIYKEKKYDYIKIQFSNGKDKAFYHNWKSNGKEYNIIAIQNIIDQLTAPEYVRDQTFLKYENQNEYDSLLTFSKRLIKETPTDNSVLKYCGVAHYYLNEIDSSIYYFKKGRRLFPEDIDFPMNLAIAFGDKKQYNIAFAYLDTTLQLESEYPKAIFRRGLFYHETGDKQKACEDMRKAEELGIEEASSFLIMNCEK